jgi:hypothetical protein
MAYAALDKTKQFLGIEASDTKRDAAITNMLIRATGLVDLWTGTFFDDRPAKTVKTQAMPGNGRYLFMPANIQAVTSITEGGTVLVQGPDDDFVAWDTYIERVKFSTWNPRMARPEFGWSRKSKDVVVVADLGFSAVPVDIEQLAMEIVGVMGGWKTKSFTQDDGVERTVLLTEMPKPVQDIIDSRRIRMSQPFELI